MASGGTEDNRYRIVLMGKTGTGKSSLGNSMLGRTEFVAKASVNAVTKQCSTQQGKLSDLDIDIIDTPGLIDNHKKDGEVEKLITDALVKMAPGPHVVLMVVKGGDRFTKEEYEAYTRVKQLLDSKDQTRPLVQHMVVVFTGGDRLEESKTVMEDEIENGPPQLKTMLEEVQHRYIVIDNKADKAKNQKQMGKLKEMITEVAPRKEDFYTSDLLSEIDHEVEKEAQVVSGARPGKSKQQARREVKERATSVNSESGAYVVLNKHTVKKNVFCDLL